MQRNGLLGTTTFVARLTVMALIVSGCLTKEEGASFAGDTGEPAANSRPTISGNPPASIRMDSRYSFMPSANDVDRDRLTFSIAGRPGWAEFDNSNGSLTGTPGFGDVGDHRNVVISVSDGDLSASLATFSISVTMDNSAPTISGNPPSQINVGNQYSFTPTASDPDGDGLTFSVSGLPSWASFTNSDGSITGVPSDTDVRTFNNISITASDTSNASTTLGPFSITVVANNVNAAPTISGNPRSQVNADSAYNFTPTANDIDGDDLTFSVSGLPGWASFNTSNGSITGTPSDANIGTDDNISITVSDTSNASATLGPFSIAVVANNANTAPTISGNPPSQVNANSAYNFTPTANDADGDDLTFSESGLPVWASFNTSDGSITGTPTDANVDTYNNISITVSDTSNASATLGPFSITVNAVSLGSVTLDWTPPTQNEDGSDLADLDGYKIYWRTTPGSGSYPNSVTLENEGLTSYVVQNLVPGTYEFVATSFNTARVESAYSNPATKVVN